MHAITRIIVALIIIIIGVIEAIHLKILVSLLILILIG